MLAADLEAALTRHLGLPLTVVVRSYDELREVVLSAPEGFGEAPDGFHSDAVFLKHTLATADALDVVRLREGVDAVWRGDGVLCFRRLSARRTERRMSSIVGTPECGQMTIRRWATTTKLLELLDASADQGPPS